MLNRLLRLFQKKQRFDLPFHARLGTEFLVFLTGLMTLLCLLALTASLSLTRLADHWSSGLENNLTIELPSSGQQAVLAAKVLSGLRTVEGVKSAKLMDQAEMNELLEPWLGSGVERMQGLPLPALITVELKTRNDRVMASVRRAVAQAAPAARIDANEGWLADLLNLTAALKLCAILIMLAIGAVTALTVAGAVRSRMAIHHTELELLHTMGADDGYIADQFQRYICMLTGRGILTGFVICMALVAALGALSLNTSTSLPGMRLTLPQFLSLPVCSLLLLGLCAMTARTTVLKVLRAMP